MTSGSGIVVADDNNSSWRQSDNSSWRQLDINQANLASQPYSIPGTPVGSSPGSFGARTTQVSTTISLKTFHMPQTNGVPRTRATPGFMISNNMRLPFFNSVETAPFPHRPPWHAFNCTSELPFAESPE